ncbi:hypothetical protein [Actinomadura sp. J1-007]|uniref:hypothetical protein n=1 Tax=Actinomadura sp. J1-007 TaxID=2661913 RepID=UPI001F4F9050|nr:hypothetical protein [Actinomadura sp. J1-007]
MRHQVVPAVVGGVLQRDDRARSRVQRLRAGDGAGKGFKPGDVILMHYRKGLAQQFQMMLGWIKEQGFRPAAVQNYIPKSLGGNAPDQRPGG